MLRSLRKLVAVLALTATCLVPAQADKTQIGPDTYVAGVPS